MSEDYEIVLAGLRQHFGDTRSQVFDIQASLESNRLNLTGRVLDEATRTALLGALACTLPEVEVAAGDVRVLRQPHPEYRWIATNLTSLHSGTSFLAEMTSQMLYGMRIEVLDTDGEWVFARQDDGYLGWTYRPYLTGDVPPPPTHLVIHPVSSLRAAPQAGSPDLTRVMGGTFVALTDECGDWVEVQANTRGWLPRKRLRSLADLPQTNLEKRASIIADGNTLIGVPYLWGGCSANGIDCSGLAQLLHRWVGLTIPRDADMQYLSGEPVEPPFQPGDLIFFGEPGEPRHISHVGISLGGWNILHSSRARNGVYRDDVQVVDHLRNSLYGACTYLGD
jgi:gamma-D-glutamyl-L-lysine dipeptidyl-peptidase